MASPGKHAGALLRTWCTRVQPGGSRGEYPGTRRRRAGLYCEHCFPGEARRSFIANLVYPGATRRFAMDPGPRPARGSPRNSPGCTRDCGCGTEPETYPEAPTPPRASCCEAFIANIASPGKHAGALLRTWCTRVQPGGIAMDPGPRRARGVAPEFTRVCARLGARGRARSLPGGCQRHRELLVANPLLRTLLPRGSTAGALSRTWCTRVQPRGWRGEYPGTRRRRAGLYCEHCFPGEARRSFIANLVYPGATRRIAMDPGP